MSYLNPMQGFEPSPTTKNLLWYVNTSRNLVIGTVNLPGLFQDNSQISTLFFVIVVFLEVIGLQFIINATDMEFWQGLMGVSFLLLLDILFAFLFHLRVKTITRCESEKAILPLKCRLQCAANINPVINSVDCTYTPAYLACLNKSLAIGIQRIDSEIRKAKLSGYLCMLLMWMVAASKMFTFWSLQSVSALGINSQSVFIIVTYVIVAIIHTYCTGYALFSLFARYSWWRDENA